MWLCKTDLKKEWENRNTMVITAKDLGRSQRFAKSMQVSRRTTGEAVIPVDKLEKYITVQTACGTIRAKA